MKLIFQTKINKNGNVYQLVIDIKEKTYERGYHLTMAKGIVISKRDLEVLCQDLQGFGFLQRL